MGRSSRRHPARLGLGAHVDQGSPGARVRKLSALARSCGGDGKCGAAPELASGRPWRSCRNDCGGRRERGHPSSGFSQIAFPISDALADRIASPVSITATDSNQLAGYEGTLRHAGGGTRTPDTRIMMLPRGLLRLSAVSGFRAGKPNCRARDARRFRSFPGVALPPPCHPWPFRAKAQTI